mmetsp:Transcript_35689/g.104442  ORF Transcript_35689/g.104442 Transcript_35689/m.104442 type:complete len:222 (-) Transcript_35689:1943-2608(-)
MRLEVPSPSSPLNTYCGTAHRADSTRLSHPQHSPRPRSGSGTSAPPSAPASTRSTARVLTGRRRPRRSCSVRPAGPVRRTLWCRRKSSVVALSRSSTFPPPSAAHPTPAASLSNFPPAAGSTTVCWRLGEDPPTGYISGVRCCGRAATLSQMRPQQHRATRRDPSASKRPPLPSCGPAHLRGYNGTTSLTALTSRCATSGSATSGSATSGSATSGSASGSE